MLYKNWILPLCLTVCLCAQPSREERFLNPPAACRVLPLTHTPDRKETQEADIARLREQGFGGFGGNVSFNGYVDSEAKWDIFLKRAQLAHDAGMTMWLYDEAGYPSGTAGGRVMAGHPEWEARGLLIAATDFNAGQSASVRLPPGKHIKALAFPLEKDKIVTKAARPIIDVPLIWTAPQDGAQRWRLCIISENFLYDNTHAALSLARKDHYINLLMAEPTKRFLEITHDAYAKHLGDKLSYFTSTFTDEPSLMSCWFTPQPYRLLPWAPDLPEDYQKTTGRDLWADVPAIVFESTDRPTAKLRYEFWNLVAERVATNFMGQITDWCNQHGILSGGHLLGEEGLASHVPYYGDFFRVLRRMTAPGVDCLTSIPSTVPWHTALIGGSAAALNGSRYCMCEVSAHSQLYRKAGDPRPPYQVSADEIRGTLNRLVWGGVNTFTSYYNFKSFTDDEIRGINTYLGRLTTMLADSRSAADIALLYPAESLMASYQPYGSDGGRNAVNQNIQSTFIQAGTDLFNDNRSFMIVDSDSLIHSQATDGVLACRDLQWRLVVLPNINTLSLAAMRKLHQFWQAGGNVIALGSVPVNSEKDFPSNDMKVLTHEMFGVQNQIDSLSSHVSPKGGCSIAIPASRSRMFFAKIVRWLLPPPLDATTATRNLRTSHRRDADGDIFLVINDSDTPWSGKLALNTTSPVEVWCPEDGSHHKDDNSEIAVAIPAYGARIITTAAHVVSQRGNLQLDNLLPQPRPLSKAPVSITPSNSSAVKATLTTLPDGSIHSQGVLTAGNTDTFLFVSFNYEQHAVPADAEGLYFEANIADNQPYANELRCFINLRDGRRFLGDTRRSLARPGLEKAYLSFHDCSPFKTSGKLAPEDIVAIQIGWGGYYGSVGDKITVDISTPQYFTTH